MPNNTSANKTIRILYIASEAEPFVKIGGLGDVAGSLPGALQALSSEYVNGHSLEVRMALPFHPIIREKFKNNKSNHSFSIPHITGSIPVHSYNSSFNGVPVSLLAGPPIPSKGPVYNRDAQVDTEKYLYFSLATLELAKTMHWKPDIIHANDWHTALAIHAVHIQKNPFFRNTKTVLGIHNLPYMGAECAALLEDYLIYPEPDVQLPNWSQHIPLPLGIRATDQVITVSPTYAQEIQTPEFGCGLDNFLSSRADSVSGIINGLDIVEWNPATDPAIPEKFHKDNLHQRKNNKRALQKEYLFPLDDEIPLLIMITRMDYQKGVDIAIDALRFIRELSWNAIILGNGDPLLENACRKIEAELPQRVCAEIKFDKKLARKMYAGADILLMPSRYEPCGLAQMIAMRYGCIPIAHATGGLKDTITDNLNSSTNTGFLYSPNTAEGLATRIKQALKTYNVQSEWRKLQIQGMQRDLSWHKSALSYAEAYLKLKGEL